MKCRVKSYGFQRYTRKKNKKKIKKKEKEDGQNKLLCRMQ